MDTIDDMTIDPVYPAARSTLAGGYVVVSYSVVVSATELVAHSDDDMATVVVSMTELVATTLEL